jgi:GPH family glycoside/pentoside/hexuronide:cation symporter
MSHASKQQHLRTLAGASYALPVVPALILMSTNNVLSGLYSTHYGLALTSISLVMLIAGMFDAITDPTIGYLSDRYHARTGSRRPFAVVGAVLLIPCAWFLLNPGEGVTLAYFLVWYLLFYLAFTLFHIPHLTWGGEISPISEQKNRVYAYRNYAGYAGGLIFALVPILPFYEGTQVTPDTMRYLVIIAAVLMLPALYCMLRYVPTGARRPDHTGGGKAIENPFRALLAIFENKPAVWYITGVASHYLTGAFYIALMFMVTDRYLGLGEYYAALILLHLLVGTVAIKPALWAIARWGKVKALTLAYALLTIALICLLLALVDTGYSLMFLVLFNIVGALTSAAGNIAAYALLSDISDYGTLKAGVDRSATYFSISSLIGKTCMALGISASLALASWLGFDPLADNQQAGFWGLVWCMCLIPLLLNVIAVYCVSKIAITEPRHGVIRRRLDSRAALDLQTLKAQAAPSR